MHVFNGNSSKVLDMDKGNVSPVQLTPLARKFLEFCVRYDVAAGNGIPDKPYRFSFYSSLNPLEQRNLESALNELIDAELLSSPQAPKIISEIKLTQEGENYIYSSAFADGDSPVKKASKQSHMTINNINITNSQNVQVGDGNSMNVVNNIKGLVDEIDKSDATPEEKSRAKLNLWKFTEDPLISGLLSGAGIEVIKKIIGL